MKRVATSLVVGLIGLFVVATQSVFAVVIDLTTLAASGTDGSAVFIQGFNQNVGTGNIDSFVRIQPNGQATTEQGYNTDGSPQFDTKGGAFTHSLTLGSVPIVNIGGTDYRQFLLDINETSSGLDHFLSLDEIQVFLAAPGSTSQIPTTLPGGILNITGSLVYRLDAGGNNTIQLDGDLSSGSGNNADMFMYIPSSFFTGLDTQQVYLYSKFGATTTGTGFNSGYGVSDGFEEWARLTGGTPPVIPEPSALLLMGSGLIGLLGFGVSRKRAA